MCQTAEAFHAGRQAQALQSRDVLWQAADGRRGPSPFLMKVDAEPSESWNPQRGVCDSVGAELVLCVGWQGDEQGVGDVITFQCGTGEPLDVALDPDARRFAEDEEEITPTFIDELPEPSIEVRFTGGRRGRRAG